MKSLLLFIVLSLSVYSSESTVNLIKNIQFNDESSILEKYLGKLIDKKEFYYTENKSYEFRKYKDNTRMYLSFKKFSPLKEFEAYKFELIKTLFDGDIVLGSLVGIPELGVFMEVLKGGQIKKIYWKEKWKNKNTINYQEVLSRLGEVKIHED